IPVYAHLLKFIDYKGIIKANIVGDKDTLSQKAIYLVRDLIKGRGMFHHLVIDAGQHLNMKGDRCQGIDKCLKLIDDVTTIVNNDVNFGHSYIFTKRSCSIHVDKCIFHFQKYSKN